MNDPSPQASNLRPHPLGAALIDRLRGHPHAHVLELGTGSGRNRRALLAAGCEVTSLAGADPPEAGQFDAALSTHALLHGTREQVAVTLVRIARALKPGAPFHATFASMSDARYGTGTLVAAHAYASQSGDEAGVPHAYFDEAALRAVVEPCFTIESLHEVPVDAVIGRWAHTRQPTGFVHYFLIARNRGIDA